MIQEKYEQIKAAANQPKTFSRYSGRRIRCFFSGFLSKIWLVTAVWLLLVLLGRFLWQLPCPARSLRTTGRLCLTVLAGTLLPFLLNLLFLAPVYAALIWAGED